MSSDISREKNIINLNKQHLYNWPPPSRTHIPRSHCIDDSHQYGSASPSLFELKQQ